MNLLMFNEAELYSMDTEFIDSLIKLMSKYLSKILVRALNDPEVQEHIDNGTALGENMKYLKDKAMPYFLADALRTIPFPGKHLNFCEVFSTIEISVENLEYAMLPPSDVELIFNKLDEILQYINFMPTSFKARKADDYADFINKAELLSIKAANLSKATGLKYNPGLLRDISNNRAIFYTPREKDKDVDFRRLKTNQKRLEIWREGLKYQVYCISHNIPTERSRHYC